MECRCEWTGVNSSREKIAADGTNLRSAKMAQVDGVFQLDAVADDLVHESFECDTRDHEDHTFCGVRARRRRCTRNSPPHPFPPHHR